MFSTWMRLVGLRYRLAWAQARSRQGRIILFVIGYLILATALLLSSVGGLSAAAAGVRLGRGGVIAAVVLTGLFLNVAFASVFLGLGSHAALADSTLRRYPLSRASRRAVRHVAALLQPVWLVMLVMAVSLAVGFSVVGVGSGWSGVAAAMLFVGATYLVASLITRFGEWVIALPGGLLLAIVGGMALMMAAPLAPVWIARVSGTSGAGWLNALVEVTPPFAAARAMTAGPIPETLGAVGLLAAWCLGLTCLLLAANRLPRRSHALSGVAARWDHPSDRIAAMFGQDLAPLAGKMLRYYVRSPQTRYNYPLALPVLAVMMATNAGGGRDDAFLFALGAAPAVGVLATGTLSLNLFGFDGHGFRRYFLLPVRPVDIFRTATLVSLMPGAVLMVIGLIAWSLWSPEPVTLTKAVMLACAAFGGLLSFSALGSWTSILAPRAIPFDMTFGNKLSPAANLVFVGAMLVFFGLPMGLRALGADAVLGAWWVAPSFLAAGVALQLATLGAGARSLVTRREQMLAAIEGR